MRSIKDLIKWYFSKAALPYWGILVIDCMFVIGVTFSVILASDEVEQIFDTLPQLAISMAISLVCYLISFRIFHTYDGVIRYSSFRDLLKVSEAVLVATGLLACVVELCSFVGMPLMLRLPSVALIAIFVAFGMWVTRVWVKTLYEKFSHRSGRMRAFILGVDEGAPLAKRLISSSTSRFEVVGFVSEKPSMAHRRLLGMRIYEFNKDLVDKMQSKDVDTLIVSQQLMNPLRDNQEIVDMLVEADIKILVMPNAREWDGKSDIVAGDFHPVAVEDLLPREKIVINMDSARELISGMTVMITGAAGSIGSEMVRQIACYNPGQLVLVDQAETPMHDIRLMLKTEFPAVKALTIVGNIADAIHMERLFSRHRPAYVFHAAAYKHVPMMEDNPYQSIVNNILGTKVIADMAVKYGTKKFVMVSTDKAVNPTNVMGCSKRICEIYVQSLDKAIKEGRHPGNTRFVTTRFGNVLGSNGSVIPLFQEQIKNGGPVTVTHPDIIRYFMLIPEACKLVLEAGTMGEGGEIYIFDMGNPVKIIDLAKRMIRLSGANDVDIVFTGLRDGEKLYEEVLNKEEVTLPTFHPKIKIARVREYEFSTVSAEIGELIEMSASYDDMDLVAKMKSIVPEFKSQHSIYEVLDKVQMPVQN